MSCWSADKLRKQSFFVCVSDTCVPQQTVKTHISLLSHSCVCERSQKTLSFFRCGADDERRTCFDHETIFLMGFLLSVKRSFYANTTTTLLFTLINACVWTVLRYPADRLRTDPNWTLSEHDTCKLILKLNTGRIKTPSKETPMIIKADPKCTSPQLTMLERQGKHSQHLTNLS